MTGEGKAFRTGADAGVTRKLTGTVKIHEDPSIYVYDTPGVMVPFLGHGADGAERGLKLALTGRSNHCDLFSFRRCAERVGSWDQGRPLPTGRDR